VTNIKAQHALAADIPSTSETAEYPVEMCVNYAVNDNLDVGKAVITDSHQGAAGPLANKHCNFDTVVRVIALQEPQRGARVFWL
jgi:hypothetical protein